MPTELRQRSESCTATLATTSFTAAIRPASGSSVQAAIDRLRARRTTLVIAHRLSTVMSAERIAVLDGGRLVDSGRHEALIERCPVYAEPHPPPVGGGGIVARTELAVTGCRVGCPLGWSVQ